jgi:hypothetical protein
MYMFSFKINKCVCVCIVSLAVLFLTYTSCPRITPIECRPNSRPERSTSLEGNIVIAMERSRCLARKLMEQTDSQLTEFMKLIQAKNEEK